MGFDNAAAAIATRRRRRRSAGWGGVVLVALLLVAFAVWEGDLPEVFGDLRRVFFHAVHRFGVPGSLALLYIEESGIPLPVPGDVYVVYLGHLAAGSALKWVAAWLAIIVAVVAGSSNLYLVSRRWGHRLVAHRFSAALHLDRRRMGAVQRWLDRWGVIAIIFGRHLPGCRVPITVVAGIFKVPYRTFLPSVAVSTAGWAAFWLWLGARYGRAALRFFGGHSWTYLAVAGFLLLVVTYAVVRVARAPAADAD